MSINLLRVSFARGVLFVLAFTSVGCLGPTEVAPDNASTIATLRPQASERRPCADADAIACLTSAFAEAERTGHFAGALLVASSGNALWREAYGERPAGTPLRLDSPFDIHSLGKMFTAVAIGQLVSAEQVRFDAALNAYLPGLPEDVGASTIGQLLSHTSGLGDGPGYGVIHERGAFNYSNAGYDLLGRVVEAVADEPFETYVLEHIFAPAGMSSTAFAVPRPGGSPQGSGGEESNVDDLLRFATALSDHRLLDESMTAELTSPKVTTDFGAYGYGFMIFGAGDRTSVGHMGASDEGIVAGLILNLRSRDATIVLSDHGLAPVARALHTYHAAVGLSGWPL
jgi:D-alanyl-D-alanine carboxypeptidase